MIHWDRGYCISKAIEWANYFVLSALLTFLLVLHCIMYKKINRKLSFRIFARNRIQIILLSLLMTVTLFVKLTFIMDYADLVLLLMAQMLRFIIWSLTLMNFMKSGLDLVESESVKVWLKALKIASVVGAACFLGYASFLIYQERNNNKDVLNCKSTEFLSQSFLLVIIVSIFFFFTVRMHIFIND